MAILVCPKCGTEISSKKHKKIVAVPAEKTDLHHLVSAIYDVQHLRILFQNRFTSTGQNIYGYYVERLNELEDRMKQDSYNQTIQYPIHEWIIAQKGLSFDLAGQLIGIIQDIKRFDNVSKLWAYFGMAVVDVCKNKDCGKQWYPPTEKALKIANIKRRQKEQADKRIVKREVKVIPAESMVCNCEHPTLIRTSQHKIDGTLLDYNPTAKMLAFKVARQFIKQGDLYRKLYDDFKSVYEERDDLKAEINAKKGKQAKGKKGAVVETTGRLHVDKMAMRKTVKVFLQHLWVQWRTLENLPVSNPYVIDRLGHTDYIKPVIF